MGYRTRRSAESRETMKRRANAAEQRSNESYASSLKPREEIKKIPGSQILRNGRERLASCEEKTMRGGISGTSGVEKIKRL